jgi:hypothetical protein
MDEIVLNRLLITGPIDDTVPLVVLLDIARAHGLEYESEYIQDVDFIHECVYDVSTHEVKKSLGSLARYINPDVQWTKECLYEAYNWMHRFPLLAAPITAGCLLPEVGEISPNKMLMNSTMVYALCRKNGIETNNGTTLEQMVQSLKLLTQPYEVLQFRALNILRSCRPEILVNIVMKTTQGMENEEVPPPGKPRKMDLSASFNKILDPRMLSMCYIPESPADAVAACAVNIGLDISRSADPLLEYAKVRSALTQPNPRLSYRPYDPWMGYWRSRNPLIFNLDWYPNPNFPHDISRGWSGEDWILPGPHPDHPETYRGESKIYLADLETLPAGEIFLIRGERPEIKYEAYTLEELTDCFLESKAFVLPTKRPRAIQSGQLDRFAILLSELIQYVTARTREKINIMLNVINDISSFLAAMDERTRAFNHVYSISTHDVKDAYLNCLIKVLHAGMYMRNWKGPGTPFPLSSAETETPDSEYKDLETRVHTSLIEILDIPRDIRSVVLSLPLVSAINGGYKQSLEPINGLTIKDRLDIVFAGQNSGNPSSCIRESSNYLCSSAHKYLGAVGHPLPFELWKLGDIR